MFFISFHIDDPGGVSQSILFISMAFSLKTYMSQVKKIFKPQKKFEWFQKLSRQRSKLRE